MKITHTPGPWFVTCPQFQDHPQIVSKKAGIAGSLGNGPVALANAHLIAAAPELLEALLLARDELQLISDANDGSHGKSLEVILEAIDKATQP